MEDPRSIGLILVWLGAIALVAVLQYRIRTGAFSEEALETVHPIGRWSKSIAVIGSALAGAGIVLTLWSFW